MFIASVRHMLRLENAPKDHYVASKYSRCLNYATLWCALKYSHDQCGIDIVREFSMKL